MLTWKSLFLSSVFSLAALTPLQAGVIIPLVPGSGLQNAIDNLAAPGDTIQLSSGIYTILPGSGIGFRVTKAITLKGVAGTILQVAASANADQAGVYVLASNVTLSTFEVQVDNEANAGILIESTAANVVVSSVTTTRGTNGVVVKGSGASLTNLIINPTPSPTVSTGHGLLITGSNVTVDTFTIGAVTKSGAIGIFITGSSNTVRNGSPGKACVTSHPIGAFITGGSNNLLMNCTITGANFQGVNVTSAPNTTIDAVTIPSAGTDGIYATGSSGLVVKNSVVTTAVNNGIIVENSANARVVSNVVVRAVNLSGIWFNGSSDGVIDNNTVARAGTVGILLYPSSSGSSNRNIVMGNTVLQTDVQQGIAVQQSDSNVIVANTVTDSGFLLLPPATAADAILVVGGQNNRIDRNTLTGFNAAGVTLTPLPAGATSPSAPGYRPSIGTYVAKNRITGASAAFTGIWLHDGSNGAYVFNNTMSTGTEGGVENFGTGATVVQGNVISNYAQTGIISWKSDGFPAPFDSVIQSNYLSDNPAYGILARGIVRGVVSNNYISVGTPGLSSGIAMMSHTESGTFSGGSTQVDVYGNTIRNANFLNVQTSDTTATAFYRNRYFFSPNGFNSVPPGADLKWDGGGYLGGNFWSVFPATGNPSRTTPYNGFVDPATSQLSGYVDQFPFASEDLGQNHAVTVFLPDVSTIAAPGSNQTISWRTNGCVLVDLSYGTPGAAVSIATNYPDVGYFDWVVPPATPATTYTVTVTCKNSSGTALGTQASSAQFTIAASGLLLRSPGADDVVNTFSTLRVAWSRVSFTGAVNVYVRTSTGGALTLMAPNQTGDFADIVLAQSALLGLPATSRAKIVIQSVTSPTIQDSNDAYFSIRTNAGAWVNPSAATTLLVGSVVNLEWVSPQGSQFVDVELLDSGSQFQTTGTNGRGSVLNLPDRGHYAYFVPERWMARAVIRLTFKDANGVPISQLNSAQISIRYSLPVAARPPVWDYEGDRKTDVVVFRPSSGIWFTLKSSTGFTGSDGTPFGTTGDVLAPADYDGDGRIDLAVFRPAMGVWFVRRSATGTDASYLWGAPSDIPVPGDYDGDRLADVAVFRPSSGTWFILTSGSGYTTSRSYVWGTRGDIPVPGDIDGDGVTDLAVFRPSTGVWYVLVSSSGFASAVSIQWGARGDIPVPGDYNGDGVTDAAVYRPSTGTWYIASLSTGIQWGASSDIPVPADYDGDGRMDIAVFRPSAGAWLVLSSSSGFTTSSSYQWGTAGDSPGVNAGGALAVALTPRPTGNVTRTADFDGDTRADVTVFRAGTWLTRTSVTGYAGSTTTQWGTAGDVPVVGDYDGDAKTDIAVYRPSAGTWFVVYSSTGAPFALQWGAAGDLPVPGDYDGDGKTDIAVFRPSIGMWFIRTSASNFTTTLQVQFGTSGDVPVTGDYDGDGITDIAVFRPEIGTWFIRRSSTTVMASFQWGTSGDIPTPGDYDGDGLTDLGVFRAGVWFVELSTTGYTSSTATAFGTTGDVPVPGDYDGDAKTDVAVFRPASGTWFITRSTNGTSLMLQWGAPTDTPVTRP